MKKVKAKLSPIEKELARVTAEEKELIRKAQNYKDEKNWKQKIEEKIPDKLLGTLQAAFRKAFDLLFEKGTAVIEKTYRKETIQKEFLVRDFAVDVQGRGKELKRLRKAAAGGNALSTLAATVEGCGLGVLGIGLPDIPVFVSVLLRGVYETALKYGFDYSKAEEKLFLLKLIETGVRNGADWLRLNDETDKLIIRYKSPIEEPDYFELSAQQSKTSDALAYELLLTKFIQGYAVVGLLGGITDPVYCRKVLKYAELKYRKRYLLSKMEKPVVPEIIQ